MKEVLDVVSIIIAIIVGLAAVSVILKNVSTKELRAHRKEFCEHHVKELAAIKETNQMMLSCIDVTLQALDGLAKGHTLNGEIAEQRKKLKKYMIEKATE